MVSNGQLTMVINVTKIKDIFAESKFEVFGCNVCALWYRASDLKCKATGSYVSFKDQVSSILQVNSDAAQSKCKPPPQKCICSRYNFDLRPWIHFQQCPSHHRDPSTKYTDIPSRIGAIGRITDGRPSLRRESAFGLAMTFTFDFWRWKPETDYNVYDIIDI